MGRFDLTRESMMLTHQLFNQHNFLGYLKDLSISVYINHRMIVIPISGL